MKIEQLGKKLRDAVGPSLLRSFMRSVLREFPDGQEVPLKTLAETALRKAKIVPRYTAEQRDPDAHRAMRERLNREAGVIIANHPGATDSFLLFNMLDREDVLILGNTKDLTSSSEYEQFVRLRGGRNLILTKTTDPTALRAQLHVIDEHIRNGGLFIIFPTGGSGTEFKDGFRVILENVLRPDDMVYTCSIDSEQAEKALWRLPGLISDGAGMHGVNTNALLTEQEIRVDERYTRAGEWKAAIAGVEHRKHRNAALTAHYLSLWDGQEKTPLEEAA